MWLIIMKMKMTVKNRSHQQDINRPWRRYRHENTNPKIAMVR